MGLAELHVVRRDGRGDDDHVGLVEIGGPVPYLHRNAGHLDQCRVPGGLEIGPRDLVTPTAEDHGDAAHAGSADPDEVDALQPFRRCDGGGVDG